MWVEKHEKLAISLEDNEENVQLKRSASELLEDTSTSDEKLKCVSDDDKQTPKQWQWK